MNIRMALPAAIAVLGMHSTGFASDTEAERLTLRGLKGIRVVVEELGGTVAGRLSKDQLQADVELRLRKAGIRVIDTIQEHFTQPGKPYLYVRVSATTREIGNITTICAYLLQVSLTQTVKLERDESVSVFAQTWSISGLGTTGLDHLEDIRGGVGDYVDRFINAYLAMNPKP